MNLLLASLYTTPMSLSSPLPCHHMPPRSKPASTSGIRISRTRASTASAGTASASTTPRSRATRATAPNTPKPPKSKLSLREDKAKKPPAEPPDGNINQYSYFAGPDPISGWSVPLLASALGEHQRGQFQQSGVLAEDMAANPWISHCLAIRSEFLTTTPLNVVAAGRGDARRCADFVREVLPDILPLTVLRDLHRNYLMMGQAVAAMDWVEYKDGKDRVWLPRIKPWQPQLTYYQQFADSDSVDMGSLVATTLNKGLVRVDAGESRWVVFSQSRLKPWLLGAVRTLGEAFLGDSYNFRDNMSFQDRFGRGIYLLRHPVSWKDEEINFAAASIRAGGGGGVLPCPTGRSGEKLVDLDMVQADGTGFKTFDATDKRTRDRIFIALLGQNMTSVGSTGGFAQARVHHSGLWRKFEADATAFGDGVLTTTERTASQPGFNRVARQWQPRDGVIRTQIMRWLSYWNYGSMDLAPYVYWNCVEPEDVREQQKSRGELAKNMTSALKDFSESLAQLETNGLRVDPYLLSAQMGLELQPAPSPFNWSSSDIEA